MKVNIVIHNSTPIPYLAKIWFSCYAQSIQNNKFTISLQYLEENVKDEVDFLPGGKRQRFLSNWYYYFSCMWLGMPKLPKITSSLFLCNILRKKWVMKLIFCMQISMKACYKLILWFWWGWSSIPKVLKIASLQCLYNISKKKIEMKLIFCMRINIKASTS